MPSTAAGIDRMTEMVARRSAAMRDGQDPMRSAQFRGPAINATKDTARIDGASSLRVCRGTNDHRDDLQLFSGTESHRNGRVTNRTNRTDGRAFTMFLMGCILRLAPVQFTARCYHQGHHRQERPCGDETVRDAEHAQRK